MIELLKNDTIQFYNKFFELDKVINKVIYYINNDFKLEKEMLDFYDKIGFKYNNNINNISNINNFIEYLKKN